MERFDVVILGAGMAGASLAWALAGKRRRVLLLEQESQPGYHSTGRSAATLHRSYGNATVRALTAASAPFYLDPPHGFSEVPLARPLGIVMVARGDQLVALEAEIERSRRFVAEVERLDAGACLARIPLLRADQVAGGMYDPTMLDLDVNAIHTAFLKGARARGAVVRGDAALDAIEQAGAGWRLRVRAEPIACDVLVNASGAWADTVAERVGLAPLGIVPMRRTAIIVAAPSGMAVERWPMVADVEEAWYVKPDAGRLLCSPADETPTPPCDAQPDELDVAICVERIEAAFDLRIRRIESRWAGLRSFARDRTPVVGFDPRAEGLFWLAGQGGYGIQTAPALAALAAAIIAGDPAASHLGGIDPATLSPARLLEMP